MKTLILGSNGLVGSSLSRNLPKKSIYSQIISATRKDADLFSETATKSLIENIKPDKNGEIQITDALLSQARAGNVIAYKFQGRRFDCGSVPGFIEATNYVYENLYSVPQ